MLLIMNNLANEDSSIADLGLINRQVNRAIDPKWIPQADELLIHQ